MRPSNSSGSMGGYIYKAACVVSVLVLQCAGPARAQGPCATRREPPVLFHSNRRDAINGQVAAGSSSRPGASESDGAGAPTHLGAVLEMARVASSTFDYPRALSLLNDAAGSNPVPPELMVEYGMVFLAAEEPARAKLYFDQALHLDPTCFAAAIGRAGVDILERDYKSAEARIKQSMSAQPASGREQSRAHALLARALLETDQNGKAAVEAEAAAKVDPQNSDALCVLAYVRAAERKPDAVRALASRALEVDSFNSAARRLLSQYLNGRAGYEQEAPEQARRHLERGRSLKVEGQLKEAAAEFEAALEIEPRYYRALIALGDLLLREGNYEKARAVARLATEVDPNGAIGQLELSYAYSGIQERARIEIGGMDFAALYYSQPAPAVPESVAKVFPNYRSLTPRQQYVIDQAVAPLSKFLPKLAQSGARHYLLSFDQSAGEIKEFEDVAASRTFDGRYYASIRGIGGKATVSGIEYLETAARGGFNTVAHEFAHQVHITAMGANDKKRIHELYQRALRKGLALDYYAAADEFEYFAQGYEAFLSYYKRPATGLTARHTREELLERDPELYKFLSKLAQQSYRTAERHSGGGMSKPSFSPLRPLGGDLKPNGTIRAGW